MGNDIQFERDFWDRCTNTFDEEQKHFVYGEHMGLPRHRYQFDAQGKSVLDIGGGPVSILLKCFNLKHGKVIDPIQFPEWVVLRYAMAGVKFQVGFGEDISETGWDEVWVYNCLQHVKDPGLLLANARRAGKIVRIFEWLKPVYEGHPIALTKEALDRWLHGDGQIKEFAEQGCFGLAYFGAFSGE
jgi:hypothetical protein